MNKLIRVTQPLPRKEKLVIGTEHIVSVVSVSAGSLDDLGGTSKINTTKCSYLVKESVEEIMEMVNGNYDVKV